MASTSRCHHKVVEYEYPPFIDLAAMKANSTPTFQVGFPSGFTLTSSPVFVYTAVRYYRETFLTNHCWQSRLTSRLTMCICSMRTSVCTHMHVCS